MASLNFHLNQSRRTPLALGTVVLFLVLIVSVGVYWSFQRGGKDFSVFYAAGKFVSEGQWFEIYHQGPDRYLYSPGFAWVFSFFSKFSFQAAMGIWSALKLAALLILIIKLSDLWMGRGKLFAWVGTCLGILLLSKPLLIDFEYGQVNLFILTAVVCGLSDRFEISPRIFRVFWSWAILSFLAFAKIFPLPLMIIPLFSSYGVSSRRLLAERTGMVFGFVLTFLAPLIDLKWNGLILLCERWLNALMQKGLPLESHNQSFTALLFHYLSGIPTAVRSEGPAPLELGVPFLNSIQIGLLSIAWSLIVLGLELAWLMTGSLKKQAHWIAVVVGFLILPSHLIWKTYFVMSIPMSVVLVHSAFRNRRKSDWVLLVVLFVGMNLSGFDLMGHPWAAYLEAASLFLVLHLLLMFRVAKGTSL